MKRIVRNGLFGVMLAAVLGIWTGCSDSTPGGESDMADSAIVSGSGGESDTGNAAAENTTTPEGRVELPTYHTAAPNLWVTLPEGYGVRLDTTLPYDIIVISRNDDPLLVDSVQIPKGMMRITVSDQQIQFPPLGTEHESRKLMMGDYPSDWRHFTDLTNDGKTFYSYELRADDYFARTAPDDAVKRLRLHVFTGGRDSAVVETLLGVAQTLSVRP